jgi:hypothetical protein
MIWKIFYNNTRIKFSYLEIVRTKLFFIKIIKKLKNSQDFNQKFTEIQLLANLVSISAH